MRSRRLSPGHGCGLCGVRDWGYDEYLGRWVCLNCKQKGVPIPERPNFQEAFDFDNWYHSVMVDYHATAERLGEMESAPAPETDLEQIIRKAEIKRLNREYTQLCDLSTIAMYLKHMREMEISDGADFYIHLPSLELQIRFDGKPDSGTGDNT